MVLPLALTQLHISDALVNTLLLFILTLLLLLQLPASIHLVASFNVSCCVFPGLTSIIC